MWRFILVERFHWLRTEVKFAGHRHVRRTDFKRTDICIVLHVWSANIRSFAHKERTNLRADWVEASEREALFHRHGFLLAYCASAWLRELEHVQFRVEWCDVDPAPWEIGRGGGSTNSEFCYALLDWGKESKHRRQKCINHGIINGREGVSKLGLKYYFAYFISSKRFWA